MLENMYIIMYKYILSHLKYQTNGWYTLLKRITLSNFSNTDLSV